MKLAKIIEVDQEKCVNCHRCISVCPVKFCNIAKEDHVECNEDLCIGCGECIKACDHNARIGLDDFDLWLRDIQNGVKTVAIVAPAVAANFPDEYLNLNGWLKSMGVKANFDVSFGAELTIKSYLKHIEENNPKCVIAQPCPALVTFIEIYKPELLQYLAPADSPMVHTMKMIKRFYPEYSGYKFVVISPCFAKKREFEEVNTGDYNVTLTRIKEYFLKNNIRLGSFKKVEYDNPPAERAVLFSTPGGLLRTAVRENPDVINIARKIEGPEIIYDYFEHLAEDIKNGIAPVLIDCLNCESGCNGGTATDHGKTVDQLEYYVEKRNREMQEKYKSRLTKKTSRRKLRETVNKYWEKGLYDRKYENRAHTFTSKIKIPSETEFEAIYRSMNKFVKEDFKNCSACGYNSCEKMAVAIHNNLNRKENCHVYLEGAEKYFAINTNIVNEFAKGNLCVEFYAEGESDVAGFFNNLNKAVSNIRKMMNSVSGLEEEMLNSVSLISGKTNSMAEFASEQSLQIAGITSAMEEMSSTIGQNSVNVKDASDKAGKAREIAEKGGTIINRTVTGMKKMLQVVETAAQKIHELGESSVKIGEIILVINDIADQTNLLALNAAIEAARAGEQGRGFAVVADEVRKLADRTTNATKEISARINSIQKETNEAIVSIESGTSEMEAGKDLAEKSGKTLEEIVEITQGTLDAINMVSAASEQQASAAEEISMTITSINEMVRNSEDEVREIAETASELKSKNENLKSAVDKFNLERKNC